MASALKEIAGKLRIGLVYKTSFDKANRTSARSNRGVGLDRALPIFAEVRQTLGVPILTDVHEAQQCARVAQVVDVLQIPAFLCRQTDLLAAAAATGRAVNVKKGQFLAPWDMANVVAKITATGNPNVLVTERGASFGYNTLVSDMRALPILARTTGAPVIFDATHFAQTLFTRAVDPVIPMIAGDLAIDVKTAALLSSAYTFPYALVQPALGVTGDFFGKTRLMILCLLVIAVSALICAVATSRQGWW